MNTEKQDNGSCNDRNVNNRKSFLSRFLSLPHGDVGLIWWSFIMAIMFFAILGGRDPYNSVYIILIYIGVPLLYCTMLYFRGEKRPSSHSNWNTENDTVPLKDFAEQNGKMQVYNYIDINGKEYSKCVFTKETSVTFSVKIGWLTAAEISANKDNLVVKRKNDGTLELTKAEGATIKHFNETPPPLDAIAK